MLGRDQLPVDMYVNTAIFLGTEENGIHHLLRYHGRRRISNCPDRLSENERTYNDEVKRGVKHFMNLCGGPFSHWEQSKLLRLETAVPFMAL